MELICSSYKGSGELCSRCSEDEEACECQRPLVMKDCEDCEGVGMADDDDDAEEA